MRDTDTESWRELLDPIVVDLCTSVVHVGTDGRPMRWKVLQKGELGWDFVAQNAQPHATALAELRVRLWDEQPQMLLTINGFFFVTGTCEIFDGKKEDDEVVPDRLAEGEDRSIRPN